jgi:acyl-CoA reductase-like NAD-dependent aldehyde dehydrogenase
MSLILKPGTTWSETYARCVALAPEAFDTDRIANLIDGDWRRVGTPGHHVSPVDGVAIQGPPRIEQRDADAAVQAAVLQHRSWSDTSLEVRKQKVTAALDDMTTHRELLAMLLVWEIGKPWRLACADVDRCIDGVRWYVENIDRQLGLGTSAHRSPLPGPVSNIASWNYPMSVQVHAELVQLLCGNAVVAKTPSQGGFHCLTLAHALMHRAGLPVTLVSGIGGKLSDALIKHQGLGALAFVGGRANGRAAATSLADTNRRHLLEQEGLNTWGLWDFAQWSLLEKHLKKGFEYGKQRCTAYPRYVVQRRLLPQFLEMYLPMMKSIRFGHPLAVENAADPLPDLEFGPVISAKKATELVGQFDEALAKRALPLYRGSIADGRVLDGPDTSAYVAPAAVLEPSSTWSLHHSEPFGPLDSVVAVDTEAEFLAAMNASNGALVASLATDDVEFANRISPQLRAFKVGINKPRSRGDREEVFGGIGESWKGCFVGGDLLVQSLTRGPAGDDERLLGNFANYSNLPAVR